MEEKKGYQMVRVRTTSPFGAFERDVTLIHDDEENTVRLVGALKNQTIIMVDQQLVNDLQELVNRQKRQHGQKSKAQ